MGTGKGRRYVVLAAVVLAAGAAAAYGADVHMGAHTQTPGIRARVEAKSVERTRRPAHRVQASVAAVSPPRCLHPDWAPTADRAYAGMARTRRVAVWSRPSGGSEVARFDRVDASGYPTVFAILGSVVHGCDPTWFRVQLSLPPNGRTGWVHAWAVATFAVHSKIVVQLSQRRLTAYSFGKPVFTTRVAVGRADAPTPVGRFFVDGRFVLRDVEGPFGVAVLGIAAHSSATGGWARGRPIALHGTNDPASIGQAASHGCVRMSNSDMRRLFRVTPAGTPVVITP